MATVELSDPEMKILEAMLRAAFIEKRDHAADIHAINPAMANELQAMAYSLLPTMVKFQSALMGEVQGSA